MGYVFQPLPRDLLSAEVPRLSLTEPEVRREKRLGSVFLSTLLAVPAFRKQVLNAVGLGSPSGAAEVFQDVRFRADASAGGELAPPDGFVRSGSVSAIFDVAADTFSAKDEQAVRRVADHLALARERKISRVVTLSNIVPDQEFLSTIRAQIELPGPDRLRSLTWMETVDFALGLLERKAVDNHSGRFLLEQYVRTLKAEVVREAQARAARDQGALFFTSLGSDWDSFVADSARKGAIDPKDPRLNAIASNWLALLRSLSLYLTKSASRDQDVLEFPNVRGGNQRLRKEQVLKRLRSNGQLLATFRKRDERAPVIMRVDVRQHEVTFQIQLNGPSEKQANTAVSDLAQRISEDMTLGATRIKIFWPTEKQPRSVTRTQAIKEPVTVAPPQHGLVPDRFIVERTVPCEKIIREPDSFVQLLALELRGFRAATRHILHGGTATA